MQNVLLALKLVHTVLPLINAHAQVGLKILELKYANK